MRHALLLSLAAALSGVTHADADSESVDEIVVTARRMPSERFTEIGNVSVVDEDAVRRTAQQHPNQIAVRVPGAWIARGSGQEHLTAIRSPVLTGPGSCGAFLFLEDGIPIRPAGFCNVNQLMEIPMAMARRIEVLRGPASAPYGANALHGTINVLLPSPGDGDAVRARLETGDDHYLRSMLLLDNWDGRTGHAGGIAVESYGGFREASGHDQTRGFLRGRRDTTQGQLSWGLSGSWLEQETAGLIRGQDAWRDDLIATSNPNPEAYRNARSVRAHVGWSGNGPDWLRATAIDARAFARWSDMEFLQHFLPGQPLENNDQVSAGLLVSAVWESASGTTWQAGFELEGMRAGLREFQAGPTTGSAFLVETRPQGLHYDFDVDALIAAAWVQIEKSLGRSVSLRAGARMETVGYDYDNLADDGDRRQDGTPCGFGGCLYTRPPDGTDRFSTAAPNIGLFWAPADDFALYVNVARGFRPPQATELYRLQSGQTVANLDAESLDSIEAGARWRRGDFRMEFAFFGMQKDDFIFRDAEGFNVSDGKTRHVGVEFEADVNWSSGFYAHLAWTYARHTYRFDRDASRGETIRRGADVDTAPRHIGSMRAGWRGDRISAEGEWVHQGAYWLDAANSARYEGHDLLNLRATLDLSGSWSVFARIDNVLDEAYAARGDFAFGSYRYSPGRGREFFLGVEFRRRATTL